LLQIKEELFRRYEINLAILNESSNEGLGDLHFFLGMEMERDHDSFT
jgi:hypothetical protein